MEKRRGEKTKKTKKNPTPRAGKKNVKKKKTYNYQFGMGRTKRDRPTKVKYEWKIPETNTKIQVVLGNIVKEKVDAIVNAANRWLVHKGGVARDISKYGGTAIDLESEELIKKRGGKGIPTGGESEFSTEILFFAGCATTGAGDLSSKYVIHAVGPMWKGGNQGEVTKLKKAVKSVFREADRLKLSSVAMPSISSGIFKYPKDRAASDIIQSTLAYFSKKKNSSIETVRFVNFDVLTTNLFVKVLKSH